MARTLCLEFELIPEIPLLRGYLRAPDGPIHDIVEITPTGADDYGRFLGTVLAVTGQPDLTITGNFPIDLGRTTAPKAQIKRACQAAFEALQPTT
ncbi:hypothetical protein SAMN05444149_101906 [Pseudosulfitobacter pseudonitzschiae]|uniref:Uncharacterized protein n=1 Tax=Pseudosulfitobacter pseudonitzschiae TaxID=1402135 RepID=A0A073J6T0_9RHOB|nr:hypothetical protein [Pseudosulfitobacter pseudonitzschiae]KEJ97416.1 hypothetical protein SUH3_00080 [Pseudosulfitobacter pseudonitzschiae]QKS08707.1 hypothetical protein HT745_09570 [Pseudosulfitobacter pseudonitzschiae]SHE71737.1 hypothetical protein SAMN05444149_101906 [Pseudosulfitobacter pseudonitzschiae]